MPERRTPEVNLKKTGDSSQRPQVHIGVRAAVCSVAWQRFNVRIGFISVLASNVSRVTVKKSADDGRRQRGGMASHLDPLFLGPSAGADSDSGARLKAPGGEQKQLCLHL